MTAPRHRASARPGGVCARHEAAPAV